MCPRPYNARLQVLGMRIYTMLLRTLCWGVLSLAPLVASANVKECLSDELISALPAGIQEPARDIKELLTQPNGLQLDQPQTWGPADLGLFNSEYFPKLKALVIATLKEADFFRGIQAPSAWLRWPRDLKAALECLMALSKDPQQVAEISVASLVSRPALFVAESNFYHLYQLFKQLSKGEIQPSQFNGPQWQAEAATLELRVEIDPIFKFVERLVEEFAKPRDQRKLFQWLGLYGDDTLLEMGQILNGLTKDLEVPFSRLRSAKARLLAAKAQSSWIFGVYLLWEPVLHTAVPESVLSAVLNRFRARFLFETIMLQLEGTNFGESEPSRDGSGDKQHYDQLSKHTETIRKSVEAMSTSVQSLEEQMSLEHPPPFMDAMMQFRLLPPADCRDIRFGLCDMLTSLSALQAGAASDSAIDFEALQSLSEAHQVARLLVESYARILDQALRRLEDEGAKESFLLSFFHSYVEDESLILAKDIMNHVKEMLGGQPIPGVKYYDWNDFPLRRWYSPPSQVAAEHVGNEITMEEEGKVQGPKESLLTKRGRNQQRDEPEAKRRGLGSGQQG